MTIDVIGERKVCVGREIHSDIPGLGIIRSQMEVFAGSINEGNGCLF